MNRSTYRKVRAGARVRTTATLSNGLGDLPAGAEGTVEGKHGGFDIRFDPCDCCGLAFRCSKVRPTIVELIGDPDPDGLTGTTRRTARWKYEL